MFGVVLATHVGLPNFCEISVTLDDTCRCAAIICGRKWGTRMQGREFNSKRVHRIQKRRERRRDVHNRLLALYTCVYTHGVTESFVLHSRTLANVTMQAVEAKFRRRSLDTSSRLLRRKLSLRPSSVTRVVREHLLTRISLKDSRATSRGKSGREVQEEKEAYALRTW